MSKIGLTRFVNLRKQIWVENVVLDSYARNLLCSLFGDKPAGNCPHPCTAYIV